MYLKNIYLYIYIYIFFPSKTFQTNPPVFLDMTKKILKKLFHSVSHMKERKFLRFVKNERFIIWVKNKARVPHNKTNIMFFLKPRLFFPRLVFMRKNLENKMCSLNFTCDKNSSMCPKECFPTETSPHSISSVKNLQKNIFPLCLSHIRKQHFT